MENRNLALFLGIVLLIVIILVAFNFSSFIQGSSQQSSSATTGITTVTSSIVSSSNSQQTITSSSSSQQTSSTTSVTTISSNSSTLFLFPTYTNHVSILGSYLSQSRYGMAELYGPQASLYASPFLWNINTANGATNMTFTPYLKVTVNMNQITKITPSIPVNGYPGLMYGQEDWFPFAGKTETSSLLPLPMIISQLPQFYSVLNYSVWCNQGTIQDFSYDIWLVSNVNTTYLEYGDFEVMIWMYWNENISSNSYFVYAGNMTINTLINGTFKELNWMVYILPRTGSSNGWTGVYILSPIKHEEGEIGVPIAYILQNIGPYVEKAGVDIYNPSTYYLNAIQVGMEFNNNQQGTAYLGYNLYSWYLTF